MVTASFIVGILGNVIAITLFASPIKTFWWIVKNKSTEDYEGLPYILTLLSTSVWTFYGLLHPHGLLVATVNGTGAAFQLIFVILFVIYAPIDKKITSLKFIFILNITFVGALIATTLVAVDKSKRLSFVGIIGDVIAIAMYASPLSVMKTVIKTKSVEYMPFFLSLFQCMTGGIWTIFAVLIKDFFIGVPNGIGFVLASVQLVLYAMYKNMSLPKKLEKAVETQLPAEDSTDNMSKMRSLSRTHMIIHNSNFKDIENGNPQL